MNNIISTLKNAFSSNISTISGGNRNNFGSWIREPFAGAWQQNFEASREDILGYHAVYACVTLIANDISKLPVTLHKKDPTNKIWEETENSAFSPVLKKPNKRQNRLQFFERWVLSTLIHGNAYILKERDNRNVVTSLFVLDPEKVTVLVTDQGDVFYQLSPDNVHGLTESVTVPASEIIHDRMNPLYHELIGISPIYACALPVIQGREIQKSASWFFKNQGRPGGILTAPGAVSDETVEQLRAYWETNYTGNNAGKVAVLADGLQYKAFDTINAQTSQVIEQLKWTAEVVCSVFHVPPYKIGVGSTPTSGNVENENIRYFSEALQKRIEDMEELLAEGLALPKEYSIFFDVDNLWRMDSKTLMETQEVGTKAGILMINEARRKLNKPPIEGGNTAYLQEQNYSLAALAKRDAKEDPFAKANTNSTTTSQDASDANQETEEGLEDEEFERFMQQLKIKTAERFTYAN